MDLDYATHKAIDSLIKDGVTACGNIVVNRQEKTIKTLDERILLGHVRDLHVKKPAQVFPEARTNIVEAPNTTKDATKDIVANFLTRPPEHNN